jgi:hypothetical protein
VAVDLKVVLEEIQTNGTRDPAAEAAADPCMDVDDSDVIESVPA